MSELRKINKELRNYGTNLRGNSLFRIVWSDTEFELRKGTFNDFFGKIFLRSFTGVRQARKYSNIHNKWILEKFVPPEQCQFPDLPKASEDGSYEPLYVFQDKDGVPLPLNIDVCKYIIRQLFNPRTPGEIKAALERMNEKEEQDYDNYLQDVIAGDHSDTADRLKNHEGIYLGGK